VGQAVRYRGAALADGLDPAPGTPVTITVQDGHITAMVDGDGDEPTEAATGQETAVIDASDATIVSGFAD
jgi:hypothetical protein